MSKVVSRGLSFERYFTKSLKPGQDVASLFNWTRRHVRVTDKDTVVYEADVEAPDFWSDLAVTVAAKTWFRRIDGVMESSVRAMFEREANAIAEASKYPDVGIDYFGGDEEKRRAFRDEVFYIQAAQYAMFNTPVHVNVGVAAAKHSSDEAKAMLSSGQRRKSLAKAGVYGQKAPNVGPQASACFIQGIEDTMESLCALQTSETQLFRRGSGTGSNLSTLRPVQTPLGGGGMASGPVSFMRALDGWAGVTKSGGSSRRAALMRILDVYHPDIQEFIATKFTAQKMIRDLGAEGWDVGFNAVATTWTPYQNANNSVRVDDMFMSAALDNKAINLHWPTWWHTGVLPEGYSRSISASALLDDIATKAHDCGDPGMQYDTTINKWHTCKASGRINGSNPCCLTGDTLVDTSEGPLTFHQLMRLQREGQPLPLAFCFDVDTRLPVLRQIKRVWCAGQAKTLIEVVTDKGVVIRCTPEHRFLEYSGHYTEARSLSIGDRLRKIARTVNENRSGRRMINHRILQGCPNGCEYQSRFMWEQAHGPISTGLEVHHLNGDATDDRLSNFALIPIKDHRTEHSSGENNPRFLKFDMRLAVEAWEAIEAVPRLTHKKQSGVSWGRWNTYICRNNLKGLLPLANVRGIQGMSWAEFTDLIEENRGAVNDRVAAIRSITTDEPVFDLEVEGVHNFGVRTSGILHSIVVHNSEYMFLNDSACNLASLRLTKFLTQQGFDVDAYTHVARTMFIAQEILVGAASYPTEKIAQNSHDFRPLGLGYADLGAMLMQLGLPYDSDEGRASCAAVTSLLGGVAYETSAEIARDCGGAFPGFAENRDSMLQVMQQHLDAVVLAWGQTPVNTLPYIIMHKADTAWAKATELGHKYGFRNAQATVLAPTGTIGFALDCDTTGIEPDTALVKRKKLAGGGVVEYVNQSVAPALRQLGYDAWKIDGIVAHIKSTGELPVAYEGHKSDGDRWLAPYHAPVFATAFGQSGNEVSVDGHLKMMAAAQPFLSGAISKTVNVPSHYTVADIREVFVKAWRLGLKAVAVYRDGSKDQPLEAKTATKLPDLVSVSTVETAAPRQTDVVFSMPSRRRLPVDAAAHRHKFSIAGVDGYVHLGFYPDTHTVGEVFMRLAPNTKGNAHLVVDSTLQAASIALQHGADLHNFLDKWEGTDFAPSGFTGEGPDGVVWASSPLDYLAKWLRRFLEKREQEAAQSSLDVPTSPSTAEAAVAPPSASQAPSSQCPRCHAAMRRDGACTSCPTCGYGQGGCGG